MANWHARMLAMAHTVASWSKDPSRQVGAVVFDPVFKTPLAQGYNGFVRGADDGPLENCTREYRLDRTAHAETNAIYTAARHGIRLEGAHIATTLYPCSACAIALIQAGIKALITVEPDWENDLYARSFKLTRELLLKSEVTVHFLQELEKTA